MLRGSAFSFERFVEFRGLGLAVSRLGLTIQRGLHRIRCIEFAHHTTKLGYVNAEERDR